MMDSGNRTGTFERGRLGIAFLLVALAGAASAQPFHDALPPLLISETEQQSSLAMGDRLETRIAVTDYALPSSPRILESNARWSPVPSLSLDAAVNSAGFAPCAPDAAAGLNDDCGYAASSTAQATGFSLGATWRPLDALQVSVDYAARPTVNVPAIANVRLGEQPLDVFLTQEDLSLSCRLDTAAWGDLELGLRLSRWHDETLPLQEDEDASAAIGVAWELGAFRGDVTSRYMDMVGGTEGAWKTFDVSFAWRTPWNARLSVGATNLLDEPAPANSPTDQSRFEGFLGRLPYVRYQQDL